MRRVRVMSRLQRGEGDNLIKVLSASFGRGLLVATFRSSARVAAFCVIFSVPMIHMRPEWDTCGLDVPHDHNAPTIEK